MFRLLIVDDEVEIRNGLSQYFPWESLGFVVVGTAQNGRVALAFLRQNHVDVILSDIRMPEMDGIELVRELTKRKSKIKIVLLSSYREFEYAQQAMENGVRYYLLKPTKYDRFSEVFSNLREELNANGLSKSKSLSSYHNISEYYAEMVDSIKKYIEKNYKNVTLKSTADYVGMNPYYLSSFFKKHTGEMFSDYVSKIKMIQAAEMLASGDIKISAVSQELGYSTANNFSRAFKSYYQMAPSEYCQKLFISGKAII